MTTEPLAEPAMRERIARLRAALDAAPAPMRPEPRPMRRRTTRERRARPRDRVVVRRDRDRPHRGRPARSAPTSSPRRSRSTRPSGGIVPEVAARAHLRWIVPVLDEAWADAGVELGRHRRPSRSPTVPGLAGSLLVGHQLRQGARLGPRRPARRRQPPRGPRLRGLARRPGRRTTPGARLPARRARRLGRAHVPRRDARPPDLPAARQTVDDAAGEAFDKVGRLLGPRLPGRPGDRAGGRGRDAPRPRLPAGLARRLVRLQLLRAQDGGAPDRHRGARGRGGLADDPDGAAPRRRSSPSSPGGSRTRSWTCS